MSRWRVSLAPAKPNSFTSANTPIGMPRDATCSPISRATTIVSGSTPPSATSPPNRQRRYPHNPVSTLPGEGHEAVGTYRGYQWLSWVDCGPSLIAKRAERLGGDCRRKPHPPPHSHLLLVFLSWSGFFFFQADR